MNAEMRAALMPRYFIKMKIISNLEDKPIESLNAKDLHYMGKQIKEFVDVYNNVNDIEDLLYGDYTLHLKYYNVSSTYEKHMLVSLVDDATLFVRPVINVYKSSLK